MSEYAPNTILDTIVDRIVEITSGIGELQIKFGILGQGEAAALKEQLYNLRHARNIPEHSRRHFAMRLNYLPTLLSKLDRPDVHKMALEAIKNLRSEDMDGDKPRTVVETIVENIIEVSEEIRRNSWVSEAQWGILLSQLNNLATSIIGENERQTVIRRVPNIPGIISQAGTAPRLDRKKILAETSKLFRQIANPCEAAETAVTG